MAALVVYSQTKCPECGTDLLADYTITMTFRFGGQDVFVLTNLDEDGILIDVEDCLEQGQLKRVECQHCDHDLADLRIKTQENK